MILDNETILKHYGKGDTTGYKIAVILLHFSIGLPCMIVGFVAGVVWISLATGYLWAEIVFVCADKREKP